MKLIKILELISNKNISNIESIIENENIIENKNIFNKKQTNVIILVLGSKLSSKKINNSFYENILWIAYRFIFF